MPRAGAAELSRRRPQLVGTYFALSWRADVVARLMIAVPKRLARGAPTRNMIRRVVRESWRAGPPDGVACLIRLRALPQSGDALRLPDRQLKRACRLDCDQLLNQMSRQLRSKNL